MRLVWTASYHANMRSVLGSHEALSSHPVDVGHRTEATVLAELVRRGYRVLLPFGTNQRYDLVLDTGEGFLRVQCKTGRLRRGVIRFQARSIQSNTGRVECRDYRGQIDAFVVYCPETGRLYALPVDQATSSVAALRVAPTGNGQAKGIRWAADYELPA
jgi:hypothetical protein